MGFYSTKFARVLFMVDVPITPLKPNGGSTSKMEAFVYGSTATFVIAPEYHQPSFLTSIHISLSNSNMHKPS